MSLSLPELPYAHDALAPYMSRETLEYHHDKHHLAYVNNGNNLAKGTEWENKSVEEIVKGTFGKNQGLFNNAGQHYNHIHFWKWMKPGGGGDKIPGELEKKITADLGSVANMKEEFIQAGVTQFGSGWCWLAVVDGKIVVMKTLNGENPLVQGGKPILGCDVWEHSYYIDYRNRLYRFPQPTARLPQGPDFVWADRVKAGQKPDDRAGESQGEKAPRPPCSESVRWRHSPW
jgi:Fe-Mn family superoxide dismutase